MFDLSLEFDRQLANLIAKGYPQAADLSTAAFTKQVEPLKSNLRDRELPAVNIEQGTLPFVIVISRQLIPPETAMSLTELNGKSGFTKLFPHQPQDFLTTEVIPQGGAYLLLDIDRGRNTLNVTPHEALQTITQNHRSPLTIEEGIALITQFPSFLAKNNCFSLLASRCPNDKRVPAIWINAQQHPNLGWCWEGNPHTWLGSASCALRVGN